MATKKAATKKATTKKAGAKSATTAKSSKSASGTAKAAKAKVAKSAGTTAINAKASAGKSSKAKVAKAKPAKAKSGKAKPAAAKPTKTKVAKTKAASAKPASAKSASAKRGKAKAGNGVAGKTKATRVKPAMKLTSQGHVATGTGFPTGALHIVHETAASFEAGLRPHFEYRDLGMKAATSGKVMAQVIRPTQAGVGKDQGDLHYHILDFQMVYVLKGWARVHFEGVGERRLDAGSCMYQEPGIHHRVLEFSDDYTVIEITIPADFDTVSVAP